MKMLELAPASRWLRSAQWEKPTVTQLAEHSRSRLHSVAGPSPAEKDNSKE
jgi:hypothetical protein